MESQYRRIWAKAEKSPVLMRSNEYIQAKLFQPDLNVLVMEMGPNCNLACFHCSVNCGPDREGTPSLDVMMKAAYGAINAGVPYFSLTLGEPLREENRAVLEPVAACSGVFSTCFVTNGTFAITYDSAVEWLRYLKKIGFNFSPGLTHFDVSLGRMYPNSLEQCENVLRAVKKELPNNPGRNVSFSHVGSSDEEDFTRVNGLLAIIEQIFGKRRHEHVRQYRDELKIFCYPKEGPSIRVDMAPIRPWGRASELAYFDKVAPRMKLGPKDLSIPFSDGADFVVFHNGDVCFSDCTGELERKIVYGNVNEQLRKILERIRADVFFQGYKLGGDALLYYVAQKLEPGFVVEGRTKHDVRKAIFDSVSLVKGIRKYLLHEGVVDVYKEYINGVDMTRADLV